MPAPDTPFSFNEAYLAELQALRPGKDGPGPFDDFPAEGFGDGSDASRDRRAANLRAIYTEVDQQLDGRDEAHRPLSALCFSGGGIRSATFNLGVLQALARFGVLGKFDYISSVSGGGYISGWLAAWRRRTPQAEVFRELSEKDPPPRPLAPEPKPLDHLREFSNFLTPRVGAVSVDLWTAVAIIVRNLLLNWLVLLPVLAALVALPQLCLLVVQVKPRPADLTWMVVLGLALGFVADLAAFWIRSSRLREESDQGGVPAATMTPSTVPKRRRWSVVSAALAPLWASCLVTVTAVIWATAPNGAPAESEAVLDYAFVWLLFSPLIAWAVSGLRFRLGSRSGRPFLPELVALVGSGSVAAILLVSLHRGASAWLAAHPALFVSLAVPAVLAVHLLAKTIFVGIGSVGEKRRRRASQPGGRDRYGLGDMDREWWARLSGWVLIAALIWLVSSLLVLAATPLLERLTAWIAAMGGISGAAVALLGKSGKTMSGRRDDTEGSRTKEMALTVAVPLFCACIVVLLALGTVALGRVFTGNPDLLGIPRSFSGSLGVVSFDQIVAFAVMMAGLFGFGALMAWAVNVNRFSLQAMYRNRLVRAYLGASNTSRDPDTFTGFDPHDDVPLHECRDERPLPVINAALNLVRGGESLAWQQRKAESFSMSPLFCGNFYDGYRRSEDYAGGIRLGSAVAISGAAANPNMGYHSSPAVTFLLTLLNARLGAWLGNTGSAGNRTFRFPGPVWALRPILSELFGRTDSKSRYVNLSDGGHFENLGVYEMVLRRCRYVVVSDAGQDPKATFDDLGNAIRKIRIDFRIPIDFEERIHISPREDLPTGMFCARARIRYSEVDGEDAADGVLLYVKPALYGRGKPVPYDVWSYAGASPLFPHESTADQWFDESQFESYRALGLHALTQIADGFQGGDLPAFFRAVDGYLKARVPAP
ncbi:patatin-like phospholipase family protein [Longimicrobium sp.]|uniref:patatin-like phospholipase family protein n=1 Tax=Longimicrobium sp. TaxID=2029185 RepID=UPI002C3AD124|nr:patatin-like phospholipase family protein [Longimicrobium sp.]HSU12568.1 patatin-like phospholipase family protein [Longimicrobium sp.]